MLVNCEECGIQFKRKPSEIGKHIYCSKFCFKKAESKDKTLNGNYRGGQYIKCVICGKEHYRTPCLLKITSHPTCSKKCAGIWTSQNMIGEKGANYKGIAKVINCGFCGKEFKTRYNKFCSRKCAHLNGSTSRILVCDNCGQSFKKTQSYIYWHNQRGHKKFYCSKKCHGKAMTGENSHNWIKDRSKLKNQNKSIRWSNEMNIWRREVFQRDNYTCQMCGARSGKKNEIILNAHHIRKFINNNNLRFNLNNGITLCESCHKLTYNREEKYEIEFINIIYNEGD